LGIELVRANSALTARLIVRRGKTPVLDPAEARQLIDAIDTTTIIGLRDRALIGLMVYSFARIGAAIGMRHHKGCRDRRRFPECHVASCEADFAA